MTKNPSKNIRKTSPFILHFNSGGCNGCDIEIAASLSPKFNIEKYGNLLEASPQNANILLTVGPVTLKQVKRLKETYNQMPEPKCVISVGSCTSTGGVFKGLYNVKDGLDNVIPVDVYIAGCPPRPDEIIDGVKKAVEILKSKRK